MNELPNEDDDATATSEPPSPGIVETQYPTVPAIPPPYTRTPAVQEDLVVWYALDRKAQCARLSQIAAGRAGMSAEALVHILIHTHQIDTRMFTLAYEALSVSAARRILRKAKGLRWEDRVPRVADILSRLFELISRGAAHFAEANFDVFCLRASISLDRRKKAIFERHWDRDNPSPDPDGDGYVDPLDSVAAPGLSSEDRLLLEQALKSMPENIREACIQRFFLGLSLAEIADKHDVTDRTIRTWLKEAVDIGRNAGERK